MGKQSHARRERDRWSGTKPGQRNEWPPVRAKHYQRNRATRRAGQRKRGFPARVIGTFTYALDDFVVR